MRITLILYAMLSDHLPPEDDGQRRKGNELPLDVPDGTTVQGIIDPSSSRRSWCTWCWSTESTSPSNSRRVCPRRERRACDLAAIAGG